MSSPQTITPDVYEAILKCNRCGFCQPFCPTYMATRDETQLSRGRVHLVRQIYEGRYDWDFDPALIEKVNDCLLCGACTQNCPGSVETADIMRAFREDYIDHKGLSLLIKLMYRGMLSRRERLERLSALMRLYDKSGLRNSPPVKAVQKAFSLLEYLDSFLPSDTGVPARRTLAGKISPAGEPRLKVRFFLGCASNVFGPRVVTRVVDYLVSQGIEIEITDNVCCGEPHRTAGDLAEVRRLADINARKVFAGDYDFIITDCATCGHALKIYDQFVTPDSEESRIVAAGLDKVMEINTFILEHARPDQAALASPAGLAGLKVTYHDPCHSVRGLEIKEAPREILRSLPGLEFVEMEGADSCCGGAGSYGVTHRAVAEKIAEKKLTQVQATGASVLATSCPSCILQLGAAVKRAGLDIKVVHPSALLAEAVRAAGNRP
ncbi:(Fe-S)-binding protein [Deltaproteobacteria bacterium OttesenSCG-928-M10]|nr:(Fe-S)-binding protein [Deltaproteobacteria bacterium OttesenSCG-928-M10]